MAKLKLVTKEDQRGPVRRLVRWKNLFYYLLVAAVIEHAFLLYYWS